MKFSKCEIIEVEGPDGRAGDSPISRKRVGKGGYQTRSRRRESDDPLLITGSQVRSLHNPLEDLYFTRKISDLPIGKSIR